MQPLTVIISEIEHALAELKCRAAPTQVVSLSLVERLEALERNVAEHHSDISSLEMEQVSLNARLSETNERYDKLEKHFENMERKQPEPQTGVPVAQPAVNEYNAYLAKLYKAQSQESASVAPTPPDKAERVFTTLYDEVPEEVIKAVRKVETYFNLNCVGRWAFMGIQKRTD